MMASQNAPRLTISAHAALAAGVVLTFLVGAFLLQLDSPLRTTAAPWGIASLELAWSTQSAEVILASWSAHGVLDYARLSLAVDLAFPLLYAGTLALACHLLARGPHGAWPRIGRAAVVAAVACAPLDLLENACLMRLIASGVDAPTVYAASMAATVKFVLLVAALTYVVAGGSRRLLRGSA